MRREAGGIQAVLHTGNEYLTRSPLLTVHRIGGMFLHGVGVNLIQQVGGVILSLVLIRLISKEDFGAFGVASAIVLFLMSFSVSSFAERAFFVEDDGDPRFDQHMGLAVILHGAISAVILTTGCVFLLSENYAQVAPLMFVGAAAPLLNVPRIVYSVYLQRNLEAVRLRTINLTSFLLGAVAAIVLAISGRGGLALMAQVALTPVPFILDMVRRRPELFRVSFNFSGYGSALEFGLFRSAGGAVLRSRDLLESLVITAGGGLSALGIYGRAVGLARLTTGWLGAQLATIAFPIISKLEPGSLEYRRASALLLRLCLWTAAPPAVATGLADDAAIRLLFGLQWLSASDLVRPVMGMVFVTTLIGGLNLVALGTLGARFVFLSQVAALVVSGLGLILAYPTSLAAYAWFLTCGLSILALGVAGRVIMSGGLELRDLLRAISPVVLLVLTGVSVASLAPLKPAGLMGSAIAFLGLNAFAVAFALLLVRLLDHRALLEALKFAPVRYQGPIHALLRLGASNRSPAA